MSDGGPRVVRWLDGPRWLSPLEIWDADPPRPIEPDWALIFHSEESTHSAETFVLEFATDAGEVLAHFQFETLEIALDQAHAIAGIAHSDWIACDVLVPREWEYPTRALLDPAG